MAGAQTAPPPTPKRTTGCCNIGALVDEPGNRLALQLLTPRFPDHPAPNRSIIPTDGLIACKRALNLGDIGDVVSETLTKQLTRTSIPFSGNLTGLTSAFEGTRMA